MTSRDLHGIGHRYLKDPISIMIQPNQFDPTGLGAFQMHQSGLWKHAFCVQVLALWNEVPSEIQVAVTLMKDLALFPDPKLRWLDCGG